MRKSFMLALLMILSAGFAHAENEQFICAGGNDATVVEVNMQFKGSFDDVLNKDQAALGTLKIVKFAGQAVNREAKVSGVISYTAKGPFYDTKGGGVDRFFVSAPASEFPSTLQINGVEVPLNCN